MTDHPDFVALVREARDVAVAATTPRAVGDHGLTVLVPDGYRTETIDVRTLEDLPRCRSGVFSFVGVDSFARYADRYSTSNSLAYVTDVYGRGTGLLTSPVTAVRLVFDDHPASVSSDHELDQQASNREHVATLVLKPTAAAARWGAALGHVVDQETFLDLVVDGIAEIANPDGARLRDLVSNLHAIRTTEVKSVLRTGGEGAIELAENVQLQTGTGNKVTFPEQIDLVFAPYAAIPDTITLPVRVKARVRQDHVVFELVAPDLDARIALLLGGIAGEVLERTGLNPLWTP
jgi:hypothetical protein